MVQISVWEKGLFKLCARIDKLVLQIIDEMIVDALIAADKAYPLPGGIHLSQAIDNLEVCIIKLS